VAVSGKGRAASGGDASAAAARRQVD